ncbi:MAG: hypothetical protein IPJ68_03125 [Candidatus Moraniibacteriota bacterium]|nr:MAG: hypothetical protein IPJ68_03125 [Candidatus Moranbacteria bacterium]
MRIAWLQAVALGRRAIDPAPRTVTTRRILLVALGEVEVAGNGLRGIVWIAGAVTDILGLGFGIEGFIQAERVDSGTPGGFEPGLGGNEVGWDTVTFSVDGKCCSC